MQKRKKKSSYHLKGKSPFSYNTTPLNKKGEGVAPTHAAVAEFEARVGIRKWRRANGFPER